MSAAVTPGQQDRGMDNTMLFDTRLHTPDDPDWRPLEAVARLSRSTDELPTLADALHIVVDDLVWLRPFVAPR